MPSWDDLTQTMDLLGSEVAFVEFHLSDNQVVILVLRPGWDAPKIVTVPISRQQLFYRYLLPYRDEITRRKQLLQAGRQATHDWLKLGELLLTPLNSILDGAQLVYFASHSWLHFMPLHALTVHGAPFISQHEVLYIPSLTVLMRLIKRSSSQSSRMSSLVMGYTPSSDQQEQELFLSEAQAVANHLGCQPLLDSAATKTALREQASSASRIHLSCHGLSVSDDPLEWAVHLADGLITARDWMNLDLRADLVTVSACNSGLIGLELESGNAVQGLPLALLYAGSQATLLTLWHVNANSTKEWMIHFYERAWKDGVSTNQLLASAFQRATLAILDQNSDPYYWAPFTLVGAAI